MNNNAVNIKQYHSEFYLEPNEVLCSENIWYSTLINEFNLEKKKCLDFGCGTGYWIQNYLDKGGLVTGIDENPELIEFCRRKYPEIEFNIFNQRLPYADSVFDFIFSTWVFQEITDEKILMLSLKEIERVLKPNSILVIINNIYPNDRELISKTSYGDIFKNGSDFLPKVRFFQENSMCNILSNYNLSLLKKDTCGWSYCEVYQAIKCLT
jgi:ubiquinone/menaquinone biosynthesis C-methylase UbiE